MKILAISDVESKYLWDYFQPEKLEGVDLILSCGDLKASYLTLLATFTHCCMYTATMIRTTSAGRRKAAPASKTRFTR